MIYGKICFFMSAPAVFPRIRSLCDEDPAAMDGQFTNRPFKFQFIVPLARVES